MKIGIFWIKFFCIKIYSISSSSQKRSSSISMVSWILRDSSFSEGGWSVKVV